MESINPYIAIYTHKVKEYCDKEFFEQPELKKYKYYIVDNTNDNLEYFNKLKTLYTNNITHIDIPITPKESLFRRNVVESVNYLRNDFISKPEYDNFIIIESDLILPDNGIEMLYNSISKTVNWGIIGGLYYKGFHDYNKIGVQQTHHVLSGCSLYNRKLIEDTVFRIDDSNKGAFPDAWMSVDAGDKGYNLYNNHDIKCKHLHAKDGHRGWNKL